MKTTFQNYGNQITLEIVFDQYPSVIKYLEGIKDYNLKKEETKEKGEK